MMPALPIPTLPLRATTDDREAPDFAAAPESLEPAPIAAKRSALPPGCLVYRAYCKGTSPRAVYVRLENVHLDGGWGEYWIPRSVVSAGSEIEVTGDSGKLILPRSFAKLKNLTPTANEKNPMSKVIDIAGQTFGQ
jgi:hypothetical protein